MVEKRPEKNGRRIVNPKPATKRKIVDKTVKMVSGLGAFIGIFFLVWILYIVIQKGASSINWDFFTKLPYNPMPVDKAMPVPTSKQRRGL